MIRENSFQCKRIKSHDLIQCSPIRRQLSFRGLVSDDQAMKVGFDREQWMAVDDSKGKEV